MAHAQRQLLLSIPILHLLRDALMVAHDVTIVSLMGGRPAGFGEAAGSTGDRVFFYVE